jgi:hypothetical protein
MQLKLHKSDLEFVVVFCDDVIVNVESSPAKFGEDYTTEVKSFVIVQKETKKPFQGATLHTNVPFVDGFFIYNGEKYISFDCQPDIVIYSHHCDDYESGYEDGWDYDDYSEDLTCEP